MGLRETCGRCVAVCYERNPVIAKMLGLCPLLAVTDPSLLAGLSDGTLVVARCNSTQSDALQKGVERLRAVDAPLLGAVLNRLPTGRLSRYYGGEYSYYSDYYTRDDPERIRASDKLKGARRTQQ